MRIIEPPVALNLTIDLRKITLDVIFTFNDTGLNINRFDQKENFNYIPPDDTYTHSL